MKEKHKKAESKKETIKSISKRSFETDPALKDIALNLEEKCSVLREEEDKISIHNKTPNFEKLYPLNQEISVFIKELGDTSELQLGFKESLSRIAKVFNKAFSNLKDSKKIDNQIKELLVENFFHTAQALALAVEARDPYTGGHSDRVFQMATELGKRCNISPIEQLYLEGGSLLHDIGKIGIRDGVLLKPGPLTDIEYKEMQLHTIFGAQIVKRLDCLQGCIDAVLLHHERIDGYGYPYGLKGKEIPLIARITSVADAYDAMTTNRVYRKALSHEYALEEIIRNSGTQFDPEVVKEFTKWWEDTHGSRKQKNNPSHKRIHV